MEHKAHEVHGKIQRLQEKGIEVSKVKESLNIAGTEGSI